MREISWVAGKLLAFQEGLFPMELGRCLVNGEFLRKSRKSHTAAEIKFLWQQLNITWSLDKFRDKDGNWKEHIQRVEGRYTESGGPLKLSGKR